MTDPGHRRIAFHRSRGILDAGDYMYLKWIAIAGVALVSSSWVAAAPDLSRLSEDELEARIKVPSQDRETICEHEVAVLTELHRRAPEDWNYRARLATARINCASLEKRYDDALRLVRQADLDLGRAYFDARALYFAMQLKDGSEILLRMRSLAEANKLAELSP